MLKTEAISNSNIDPIIEEEPSVCANISVITDSKRNLVRRGKFVSSKLSGNYINVFRSDNDKIITIENLSHNNIKVANHD